MTDPEFPDLAGRSVLITGGGSGIGAALTLGFLRQGARVTFLQRSDAAEFCTRAADQTGRAPGFIACDLADPEAIETAVAKAAALDGPATVLINNAADDTRHQTLTTGAEDWDRIIAVNLRAYFLVARAVIPGMQAAGGGSIVNMGSISHRLGNRSYPVYATANAGIEGLTRSLAREFGPDGIRVNTLAPGWVMTQRQKALWVSDESLERHLNRQCIGRPLEPEDIVAPTLFLAADASRMITAQTMVVDGGTVFT